MCAPNVSEDSTFYGLICGGVSDYRDSQLGKQESWCFFSQKSQQNLPALQGKEEKEQRLTTPPPPTGAILTHHNFIKYSKNRFEVVQIIFFTRVLEEKNSWKTCVWVFCFIITDFP